LHQVASPYQDNITRDGNVDIDLKEFKLKGHMPLSVTWTCKLFSVMLTDELFYLKALLAGAPFATNTVLVLKLLHPEACSLSFVTWSFF
jgi:hypothetical protein